jgi:energy-coupling factor transport system substrate-specific component
MAVQAQKQSKGLFTFGTREVVYSAIGAALYAVLAVGTNFLQIPASQNVAFRPAVVIPMFFGVAFGPIVGFISGFLGNILSDMISGFGFWFWWDVGNGILGLIPGLIAFSIINYRDVGTIIKAEIMVILGILVGMGLASLSELWVSGVDLPTTIVQNFLPAVITDLIFGLILVPILMVAYQAVTSRSGR